MIQHARRDPLLLPALSLAWRDVRLFLRQPSRVAGALATPVVLWLVIGSGLGRSFSTPMFADRVGYLEYFFPGVFVMILLFTAIFNMISVIEDRRAGFLQAVLVAPVARAAIPLGKILGSTCLGVAQAMLFLALAPLAGVPVRPSTALGLIPVSAVLAFGLSGLGFVAAWRLDSPQGFHAVMNLVLMPMWLLSGAVFPAAGASAWLRAVLAANPLTYGVAAIRLHLYGDHAMITGHLPPLPHCLLITLVFSIAMLALSIAATRGRHNP